MKLYEKFADNGFHSSIVTTFGIDFDAYENIVLPRLRGAGCRNNIIVADQRMLTYALGGDSPLPRHAGKLYGVTDALGGRAGGVFHPKVILQLGRKRGRLIVGSANLTSSGLAGNLELVSSIECDAEPSNERRLIAQAFTYLRSVLRSEQNGVAAQLDWLERRTPWLAAEPLTSEPLLLGDGTMAAFLGGGEAVGIAARFAGLVGEPVTRLSVISPYWDEELTALGFLAERLSPSELSILIDPENAGLPIHHDLLSRCGLFDRAGFHKGRFIHAKLILAQTKDADHLLFGSANCTFAAMGHAAFGGLNQEACVYRRLPAGSVLEHLGLLDAFAPERIVDPARVQSQPQDEIPLDTLGAQHPGQFEVIADILSWQPSPAFSGVSARIELLTPAGDVIACDMKELVERSGKRRFQMEGAALRPSFARVMLDMSTSAPAVIAMVDDLRAAMRESRGRRVDQGLQDLDGDTEASLHWLEMMDTLERIEGEEAGKENAATSLVKKRRDEEEAKGDFKLLTYAEFMQSRRPRIEAHASGHSTLAGSDVSALRSVLNRLVGFSGEARIDEPDEESGKNAFDLGDETSDPDALLEEDTSQDLPEKPLPPRDEEAERRRAARLRATKEQIVEKGVALQAQIKQRQLSGKLATSDLLRARIYLSVVCDAAFAGKTRAAQKGLNDVQVLPSEGDANAWPYVIGRMLFFFFSGNNPIIRDIPLRTEHDQVPDDVIECWVTCYWCIQAAIAAPVAKAEKDKLVNRLTPVAEKICWLTLPTREELTGPNTSTMMDALSKKYAKKMGVDPVAVRDGHQRLVARIFAK